MKEYGKKSIVEKAHAKIISKELIKRGSKVPSGIKLSKDRSLANLLSLACGGGKYALEVKEIAGIGNSEFCISESEVKELCEWSPFRLK